MTVMVTGASGVVGRAVVKALLARDEVRATVRRPVAAEYLRQLGAKVAVREIDRPDDLARDPAPLPHAHPPGRRSEPARRRSALRREPPLRPDGARRGARGRHEAVRPPVRAGRRRGGDAAVPARQGVGGGGGPGRRPRSRDRPRHPRLRARRPVVHGGGRGSARRAAVRLRRRRPGDRPGVRRRRGCGGRRDRRRGLGPQRDLGPGGAGRPDGRRLRSPPARRRRPDRARGRPGGGRGAHTLTCRSRSTR